MDTKVFDPEAAVTDLRIIMHHAGREILRIRESGNLGIAMKGGEDFLDIATEADRKSEAMIGDYIKRLYPGHQIRGEEGTNVTSKSPYRWYADPLDGSKNFAAGHDYFGVSLAVYEDDIGLLGMMHYPALKKLVWAVRGKGAFVNETQVTVGGKKRTLRSSVLSAGLVPGTRHLFDLLCNRSLNVLAEGSFVVESLQVLEGILAAQLHSGATPYDCAAARIIVEEAGGFACGFKDDIIDLNQKKIPIILAESESLAREIQGILP